MGWDLGLPSLCKGRNWDDTNIVARSACHREEPRKMSTGWNSSARSERISHRKESLLKENLRECQSQGVPGSEAELEQSWGGLVGGVAWCRWADTAAPQGSSVFLGGPRAASLPKPHNIWGIKSHLLNSRDSNRNLASVQEWKVTFLAHKLENVNQKGSKMEG